MLSAEWTDAGVPGSGLLLMLSFGIRLHAASRIVSQLFSVRELLSERCLPTGRDRPTAASLMVGRMPGSSQWLVGLEMATLTFHE